MKRWLVALAAFLVLAALLALSGVFMMSRSQADLSVWQPLVNPQITTKPDQRMLVVDLEGSPSVEGGKAMGTLFGAFFRLKGLDEAVDFAAPRGRWSPKSGSSVEVLAGTLGIPIPDTIDSSLLTAEERAAGLDVRIWTYGLTAEILHVGSYATEDPTIRRLEKYITDEGMVIAGLHEEEYLKGPGMFFAGNPDTYHTVIRYTVEPLQVDPTP